MFEEIHCLERASAHFAVEINYLVRVQLSEALGQFAERDHRHAIDFGNLGFVVFAHIDHRDVFPRQRFFHLLHGDFVGMLLRFVRLKADAAKLFVIDQLRNGRVVAADRALGIAAQFQLTKFHIQRIEEQKAIHQRRAFAECEFQDFRGLDAADDARQHAKHAAFRAARHHPRRWRFGIQTAIARPAQFRREHAGLAFETKNGAVHVWLFQKHAGVVGQITRWKIIRAVHHDVVRHHNFYRVLGSQPRFVNHHFHLGINRVDGLLARLHFGPAHIGRAVGDLSLQV